MKQIEMEILRRGIRRMTRQSPLYKLLKEELTNLGYWKNKRRGSAARRL